MTPTVAVEVTAAASHLATIVAYLMANLFGSLNHSMGEISTLTIAATYLFASTMQDQSTQASAQAVASLVVFILLIVLAIAAWRRYKWTSMLARKLTSYLGVSTSAARQLKTLAVTSSMGLSVVVLSVAKFTGTPSVFETVLSVAQTASVAAVIAVGVFGAVNFMQRLNFIAPLNNSQV